MQCKLQAVVSKKKVAREGKKHQIQKGKEKSPLGRKILPASTMLQETSGKLVYLYSYIYINKQIYECENHFVEIRICDSITTKYSDFPFENLLLVAIKDQIHIWILGG